MWREAVARTHGAGLRVVTGGGLPPVTYARIPRSARLSSALLRVTKARNPRDGLFSRPFTPALRGVQRLSPNDPRNGSMRRALTVLRESWVNDSSALQGVQRSSPNDSRKGSNSRALTALLESWVNDSRDWAVPTGTPSRCRVSAARRWRAGQQPRTTGVVSRAQQFPLRLPLAPRRAETLTRLDYTAAARTNAL